MNNGVTKLAYKKHAAAKRICFLKENIIYCSLINYLLYLTPFFFFFGFFTVNRSH